MQSIGFLIGGALINALAFSGSNFLFSSLSKESIRWCMKLIICQTYMSTVEIIKGWFWCSLPLFDHFCGAPTPSV